MEFEDKLREAGLTGNEAKAYLRLLKVDALSANELAKRISIDRTLAYTILNNLVEKGMVKYIIKSHKKYFSAADPSNLLNPVRKKEILVKDLIDQLKDIERVKEAKQEINIYEGKEGLRTFVNLLLKHKKFVSFGATGRAYEALYEAPALLKELIKKGLKARIITESKYKGHSITKVKQIEARYLDIKSEATTTIFGDYVSIHILTQKPLIIVIKNSEIADSYKNYFDVIWKTASK